MRNRARLGGNGTGFGGLLHCLALACLLLCLAAGTAAGAAAKEAPSAAAGGSSVRAASAVDVSIFETAPRPYHHKGDGLVRATGKDCRACHVGRLYPQGDFFGWEFQKKWEIHWGLFSLSLFVMILGIYGVVGTWRRGRRPSLHNPVHWPSVLDALLKEVILGRRIWIQSRKRWAVFMLISVSFLFLAAVFVLTMIQRFLLPPDAPGVAAAGLALDFCADFLGGCILVGILLAFYRRFGGREVYLQTEGEDVAILLLLFGIVTTGFFLEACRLAVVSPEPRIWASFLGAAGAAVLRHWDLPWTAIRFYVWLFHACLIFSFFAYFPFSKLFHVVTCPVSIVATASEAHYRQHQ